MGKWMTRGHVVDTKRNQEQSCGSVTQAIWLAAYRELAAVTYGITANDPRLPGVLAALDACDRAYYKRDWTEFCQAAARVRSVVEEKR